MFSEQNPVFWEGKDENVEAGSHTLLKCGMDRKEKKERDRVLPRGNNGTKRKSFQESKTLVYV